MFDRTNCGDVSSVAFCTGDSGDQERSLGAIESLAIRAEGSMSGLPRLRCFLFWLYVDGHPATMGITLCDTLSFPSLSPTFQSFDFSLLPSSNVPKTLPAVAKSSTPGYQYYSPSLLFLWHLHLTSDWSRPPDLHPDLSTQPTCYE